MPDLGDTEQRLARFARLPAIRGRLRGCSTVGELFARGAELGRRECGFDRAVMLAVEGSLLTAGICDPIDDEPSDRLRRHVLERPVPIMPRTPEALVVMGRDPGAATGASVLAEDLALREHAIAPIAPEAEVLALLVFDRPSPAVDTLDRALVSAVATAVTVTVERMVLRARLDEVATELRHLTVSAQALMSEVRDAPIGLPTRGRHSAFPLFHGLAPVQHAGVRTVLSEREAAVAALLVHGHSNREIADQLILSPETVKGHVARILRKLDASNRVEAVARYLALSQSAS
jgi:DNA-binding NarL/FixJ family response regulator